MKISIIIYSETENTETAAGYIASGATGVTDTEANWRLFG